MYPKLPYLTENGLVAPANLIAIHPSVTITPWQTLSIDFSWDALWRQRREDAFYLGPMRPVKAASKARALSAISIRSKPRTPRSDLQFKVAYVYFDVGHSLQQHAGLKNMNFVLAQGTYSFNAGPRKRAPNLAPRLYTALPAPPPGGDQLRRRHRPCGPTPCPAHSDINSPRPALAAAADIAGERVLHRIRQDLRLFRAHLAHEIIDDTARRAAAEGARQARAVITGVAQRRPPGFGDARLRAAQERGAQLRRLRAQQARRRDAAPVHDAACGDHRDLHRRHHLRQQGHQADAGLLDVAEEGRAVPARLRARDANEVGTRLFRRGLPPPWWRCRSPASRPS